MSFPFPVVWCVRPSAFKTVMSQSIELGAIIDAIKRLCPTVTRDQIATHIHNVAAANTFSVMDYARKLNLDARAGRAMPWDTQKP